MIFVKALDEFCCSERRRAENDRLGISLQGFFSCRLHVGGPARIGCRDRQREVPFLQCGLYPLEPVLAERVVLIYDGKTRRSHRIEDIDHLVQFVPVAGVGMEDERIDRIAQALPAGARSDERNPVLLQLPGLGQQLDVGCPREIEEGDRVILGDGLLHEAHGFLGLVQIVQGDQDDLVAAHAPGGVDRVYVGLSTGQLTLCVRGNRPGQGQDLSQDDIGGLRRADMERGEHRAAPQHACLLHFG